MHKSESNSMSSLGLLESGNRSCKSRLIRCTNYTKVNLHEKEGGGREEEEKGERRSRKKAGVEREQPETDKSCQVEGKVLAKSL